MRREVSRYAIREREGVREIVWIDVVRNGFWRGVRLADGVPTRGMVATLFGRFLTKEDASAALSATPPAPHGTRVAG
jgi:hypothetical protein